MLTVNCYEFPILSGFAGIADLYESQSALYQMNYWPNAQIKTDMVAAWRGAEVYAPCRQEEVAAKRITPAAKILRRP